MTIQFSKQPIAVLSEGLPKMGSGLVRRLVCARDDPGKERIRMWLIELDEAQLRSGLGLTVGDIVVLRIGTKTASPCVNKNDSGEHDVKWRLQTCKARRAGVNRAHGELLPE
jgi:hypothetical protein